MNWINAELELRLWENERLAAEASLKRCKRAASIDAAEEMRQVAIANKVRLQKLLQEIKPRG